MKRNSISDNELEAFLLLKKILIDDFNKARDELINNYPELWHNKASRRIIFTAFKNYIKTFFIIDKHHISKEQSHEVKLHNQSYY